MNRIEQNSTEQVSNVESKEPINFSAKFDELKTKFNALQGDPTADSDNSLWSFEANDNSVKISIVSNHSVNTKVLYRVGNSYHYSHSF